MKTALESPPGIVGTRVAVCSIDNAKNTTQVAATKIPNITKYNNFAFGDNTIRVWQSYNIGDGLEVTKSVFGSSVTSGLK